MAGVLPSGITDHLGRSADVSAAMPVREDGSVIDPLAAGVGRLGTHQSVAYTGVAGTIATAPGAGIVRVLTTSDAFIKIGTTPTAAATDVPITAGQPEYFLISAGQKVSAIQQSAGGTLHVTAITAS